MKTEKDEDRERYICMYVHPKQIQLYIYEQVWLSRATLIKATVFCFPARTMARIFEFLSAFHIAFVSQD